jgi:hypothetical protein
MQISIPVPDLSGFYKAHSGFTHSLAALGASLVAAYYQVPQFHAAVAAAYQNAPPSVRQALVTASALYTFYKLQKPQVEQPKQ